MTEKNQSSPAYDSTEMPPCGLLRRLASMVYDSLLVLALLMVAAAAVVVPYGSEIRSGTLWFQLYLIIVWWAYFGVCWRLGGQTVGMKAWRIRLMTHDGQRIGWPATVLRFVLAGVSAAAAGLGFLWSLFDPRRRTWHDLVTSTRLVVIPKGKKQ